ncbi:MAG: plastocyanin/azurin family copper-binding protein [Actinomycetota bacterium]|nr:plastocyanin/azurin family copper-binding protein [Actinomycetota bacterium]
MRKLALLFAFVLAVAACGGGGDVSDAGDAVAAPVATTAAPVDTHVVDDHIDDGHVDEVQANETHADDDHGDEHTDDIHADDDGGDHADDVRGDDDHDDQAVAVADRSVEVALTEFTFEATAFEVTAGETVEFIVANTGVLEHEFRLSNEHRIEEHLAAGHADHEDGAGVHHEEGGDVILLVEPGETESVTFTFGDDATLYTEVVCLIPGHYEAGMSTPLTYSS